MREFITPTRSIPFCQDRSEQRGAEYALTPICAALLRNKRDSRVHRAQRRTGQACIVACPEGITRATVLEICVAEKIPCVETDLTLEDVYRADEMFCTGTMGELASVIKVDDRIIAGGKVGRMTKRLSDLYAQRTAIEGVQVVEL
jgi:hypothetical protein